MSKQSRIFQTALFCLIALLSIGCFSVVNRLYVYGSSKNQIVERISSNLDVLALNRARIINPEYSWIEIEEPVSPAIESSIRETTYGGTTRWVQSLAQDSNLAWKITCDGQEYLHNWNKSYDTASGLLDYTISSTPEGEVYFGETVPLAPSMFNTTQQVIINPALVREENAGSQIPNTAANSYNYRLRLPSNFKIHFYIPNTLASNGGLIAQMAQELSYGAIISAMGISALVLFFFILFYKTRIEMESALVKRMTRLKALPLWVLLLTGLVLGLWGAFAVSAMNATGEFYLVLTTAGFGASMARMVSTLCVIAIWYALLMVEAMLFLYVKYIFSKGIVRYFREDTVTAALIGSGISRASRAAGDPALFARGRQLIFGLVLLFALMNALLLAAGTIGGGFGFLLAAGAELVLLLILVSRMYTIVNEDYQKVIDLAQKLQKEDFSAAEPVKAGLFQPMADALDGVRSSYQKALQDGLSMQISKTQLISNVSHDLKTPVTGIQSYAELISQSSDPVQIRKYAVRLENYARRLSRLIEDLFDVARATGGDIQLSPVDLDLSEMILQVCEEWDDEFSKRSLVLVRDLPLHAPARLDPDKTMRVIDNLLSNIRKYAMENSRVFISMRRIPGQYEVVFKNVSKTPLDFEPEEIVERFVRGDKSRHEAGSGLGLAIVRSFMEVQQGSFSVQIDGDLFKAVLIFPAPLEKRPDIPLPDAAMEDENSAAPAENSQKTADSIQDEASEMPNRTE